MKHISVYTDMLHLGPFRNVFSLPARVETFDYITGIKGIICVFCYFHKISGALYSANLGVEFSTGYNVGADVWLESIVLGKLNKL